MSTVTTAPRPASAPRPAHSGPPGGAAIDPVKIVKQYKWWLVGAGVAGAVLGLAAHLFFSSTYPLYRATVTYQASAPQAQRGSLETPFVDREELERFMLTQSLTMSSERILRETIRLRGDELAAQTTWAKSYLDAEGKIRAADAIAAMKKIVNANVKTGTWLLELSCTTTKREDAAIIANAVHYAFWEYWKGANSGRENETLDPLSRALADQRNELTRLGTQIETLEREKGITAGSSVDTSEAIRVRALQAPIAEATSRLEVGRATLKKLEDMIKTDSVTISAEIKDLVERDPVIADLKNRVASLTAEIEQLRLSEKGENHKTVREMKNRLEATRKELDVQREELSKKAFAAEVDRQRRFVDSSEAELRQFMAEYDAAVKRLEDITRTVTRLNAMKAEYDRLQNRIDQTRKDIEDITVASGNTNRTDRVGRLRLLEAARSPDAPYFPQIQIMIPLGVIAVLGLTGGVILLRELFDQRVKGPSDITAMPRVKLLGIIPLASEDPAKPAQVETAFRDAPTGAVSEGFRQVRSPLTKRMHQAGYKSLLVVGGMPEAGATSAVSNLAMGAAASDLKVLMIDANFRRPALHRVFKLGEGPGLGDVLARKVTLDAAVQATSTPNLHLLAAGAGATRTVPERLGSDAMGQLIREASEKYDLVVIDTAPAVVAGDGLAIANRCDAVVLVVKANSDKRGMVARVRDQFADVRAEFMGVIINAVKASAGGYMRKNIKAAQEYQSATTPV